MIGLWSFFIFVTVSYLGTEDENKNYAISELFIFSMRTLSFFLLNS